MWLGICSCSGRDCLGLSVVRPCKDLKTLQTRLCKQTLPKPLLSKGLTVVIRLSVHSPSPVHAPLFCRFVMCITAPTTAALSFFRGLGQKVSMRLPLQQRMSQAMELGNSLPTRPAHQETAPGWLAEGAPLRLTCTLKAMSANLHLLTREHGRIPQHQTPTTASRLPCQALTGEGQTAISGQAHLGIQTEHRILETGKWQLGIMAKLQLACRTGTE